MGFSLEMFFRELEETLNNTDPNKLKLEKLRHVITESKRYAEECNCL